MNSIKKISELLDCDLDIKIKSIEEDSRIKAPQSLFFCIKGLTVDGHLYVKQAIENGAVAIVASEEMEVEVPVIKVKDTNLAMSKALSRFYGEVDKKIKLIGVTGTDGKTTTASIIYQLINQFNRCAYIGTNGIMCPTFKRKINFTTPFPKELYAYLDEIKKADCNYVVMEASSLRLLGKRLDYLSFIGAIFTNIARDHIDKHKTMKNYIHSKAHLFQLVQKEGYCLINNDDKYADIIKKACRGKVITYGLNNKAHIMANNIIIKKNKLTFTLTYFSEKYKVVSPLSGLFNVYNLMAAIVICHLLGFELKKIIGAVKRLELIESRIEFLNYNQDYQIVLDYAHTAYAIYHLLKYLKVITKGKIITVTGSAGERDAGKRPTMGKVVTTLSDLVIFTTDDPRFEDPNDIIEDLLTKVNKNNYKIILDRKEAIYEALKEATKHDTVVIIGKGRDNYMAIGKEYVSYSDIDAIASFFHFVK